MHIKNDYDRLIGELSQNTITPGTRAQNERRNRDIKAANQGTQQAKNVITLINKYTLCQTYTESTTTGPSLALPLKSLLHV